MSFVEVINQSFLGHSVHFLPSIINRCTKVGTLCTTAEVNTCITTASISVWTKLYKSAVMRHSWWLHGVQKSYTSAQKSAAVKSMSKPSSKLLSPALFTAGCRRAVSTGCGRTQGCGWFEPAPPSTCWLSNTFIIHAHITWTENSLGLEPVSLMIKRKE